MRSELKQELRKKSRKAGAAPGELRDFEGRAAEAAPITGFRYDAQHFEERTLDDPAVWAPQPDDEAVTWLNVDGVHNPGVLQGLGGLYGLHPLVLEDIMTTAQRPKCDDLGDYLFFVLTMLSLDRATGDIQSEQVSVVLGRRFVLSFQERERPGDAFGPVRERLRKDDSRLRRAGADYLAYSLLDAVVDQYFVVLEAVGERLERIEEQIMRVSATEALRLIHGVKREVLFLRRCVWPLRDVIARLQRGVSGLVQPATEPYLRDLYDHTVQAIETIESFRDIAAGLLEIHLSTTSNRLNEIMKFMTVVATVFAPLTFIVGVYGMNFENMPELGWPWGYLACWGVMVAVAVVMLWAFRRKRWL
jgi:magnesium transporter